MSTSDDRQLLSAAERGDVEGVRQGLHAGARTNSKGPGGATALMFACNLGSMEMVQLLLERGADPNASDPYGRTSLIIASLAGHASIASVLLESGADLEARDKHGNTPLLNGSLEGYRDVVKLLIEKGAAIDTRGPIGETPLIVAAWKDHTDVAGELIAAGAGLDDVDNQGGWTPLLLAISNGNVALVRALIEAGANVNRQGNACPLLSAIVPRMSVTRSAQIATLLVDAGADPNARDETNGQTALMQAATYGFEDGFEGVVLHVLAAGADPSLADKEGKTALDYLPTTARAMRAWAGKSDPAKMERLRAALARERAKIPAERKASKSADLGPGSAEARKRAVEGLSDGNVQQERATVKHRRLQLSGKWRLEGYDTFAGDRYNYEGSYDTEEQAREAARKALEDLEKQQPTSSSGGQDGIQDQVYVIGPDGSEYRFRNT